MGSKRIVLWATLAIAYILMVRWSASVLYTRQCYKDRGTSAVLAALPVVWPMAIGLDALPPCKESPNAK